MRLILLIVALIHTSFSFAEDLQTPFSPYTNYSDSLFNLYSTRLYQAKASASPDALLTSYSSIANLYINEWDSANAAAYLDSAALYAPNTDNPRLLAPYYSLLAQYLRHFYPHRNAEAAAAFRKALTCYEKSGARTDREAIILILHYLSVDGFQQANSALISKNLSKLHDLSRRYESPLLHFAISEAQAQLHWLSFQETNSYASIDSALACIRQCLELDNAGLLPKSLKHYIAEWSVTLAELTSLKPDSSPSAIDSILNSISGKYMSDNNALLARIFHTKSRSFVKKQMPDSAELMALKAQEYIEAGYVNTYSSLAKLNIEMLRSIYDAKKDYPKVIEYNDLWDKIDEEIKANEIKELELKYEAEIKMAELKQLHSERIYEDYRHVIFVMICSLLCVGVVILLLIIKSKRKSMQRQIALINKEKEETKLQIKLKEEQTVKMQLEKYEALSDYHLMEMELIVKDKDLAQLRKDKAALDMQVEIFRRKVEDYEASVNRGEPLHVDAWSIIVEDVRQLIERHFPAKKEYGRKIRQFGKPSIDTLITKDEGSLSITHIKYCICFAIGMEISEIADCFSIEPQSVYMTRYRLKKKFGLSNDDDLDAFLQKNLVR